ncbi:DUF6328 family protein [Specibacter sp. NPDC057265]|uniref:DUF6328 family protein n=1 Tax=Specibacter sp. NPDC057265 TaxID=3346075 RepID=UPI00363CB2E8
MVHEVDPHNSGGGQAARSGRNETRNEQRDRHWNELLQELRVMQTGTQITAGFLLTLPFQRRFEELDQKGVLLYLALVVVAAVATALMLMPVAVHRQLFGLQVKDKLVATGHRVVAIVLVLIALLLTGTTALIFYMVLGSVQAAVAGAVGACVFLLALYLAPRIIRARL